MIFSRDITIDASTTEASPKVVEFGVSKGVITKFMIRPRAGHKSLAHCVIMYHDHTIAPTSKGMDLHGDNDPIDWEDNIPLNQPPFTLKLVGWNEDDTYPHTFNVIVVIIPKRLLMANIIREAITTLLRGVLGSRRAPGGE